MRIFYTKDTFEYMNLYSQKKELTSNKIPFIINWDGKLENEINYYLLMKTESDWNPSSNTPANNANQILTFLDYSYQNNIQWQNISNVQIRKWIEHLTENNFNGSTINQKLTIISSMFNWCHRNNLISNNPFISFNNKIIKQTMNVFSNKKMSKEYTSKNFTNMIIKDEFKEDIPTIEEVKEFYSKLADEDKLMALFIIETGVRKEELLQITIEMLKSMTESTTGNSFSLLLDARKIRIKGNKSRNIIISLSLRNKLFKHIKTKNYKIKRDKYIESNEIKMIDDIPVFISNRGKVFSQDKLNKSFTAACKKSGYFDKYGYSISPHNLRHFFASHFIAQKDKKGELTDDVFMYLSERLGHSHTDTTKKYYIKIVNKIKQKEDMEKYTEMFLSEFLG